MAQVCSKVQDYGALQLKYIKIEAQPVRCLVKTEYPFLASICMEQDQYKSSNLGQMSCGYA